MQEKRSAQPTGSAEGSRNWVQIRINFIIRLDTDSSCLLMVWLCASNAKAVSQELNSEWFSRPVFFYSCALTNYCTAAQEHNLHSEYVTGQYEELAFIKYILWFLHQMRIQSRPNHKIEEITESSVLDFKFNRLIRYSIFVSLRINLRFPALLLCFSKPRSIF